MAAPSPNFGFLAAHAPQLVSLGALAERYFRGDPNTALIKLRQFGETLAQCVAAKVGGYRDVGENQIDLLRRLEDRGAIPRDAARLFHELRPFGNKAVAMLPHLDQSILEKAFAGELVPQDPADEPASALLARIKASRASALPARKGRRRTAAGVVS